MSRGAASGPSVLGIRRARSLRSQIVPSAPCRPFGLLDNAGVHASLAYQGTVRSTGDPIHKAGPTRLGNRSRSDCPGQRGEATPRAKSGRLAMSWGAGGATASVENRYRIG